MTVVDTRVAHEWKVVAPWWHWPSLDPDDPSSPGSTADRQAVRATRPVFQKYDSPDLVNTFLADPQHRLALQPASDEIYRVTGAGLASLPVRERTHRRKIFLPSHHRHYLVVCSLHCDTAGFPNARRDATCETGFVVRRRRFDLPDAPKGSTAKAWRRLAVARHKRVALEEELAGLRLRGPSSAWRATTIEARLRTVRDAEAEAGRVVRAWTRSVSRSRQLQGWAPIGIDADQDTRPFIPCHDDGELTPVAGVGRWTHVDETPQHLIEATFPLTPLVVPPTQTGHDGYGETIYFGTVPTGSADVDEDGGARFDDQHHYEIRCFVRRHRTECPRDHHCTCPITWSEPTEVYQLASHFDLEGTANRPVTIQMPDLGQLKADALRLSPGGTGGVRFQSPKGSELPFSADGVDATDTGPNARFQICSFAIPLITIVAFFVFRLFLPIVIFVFQLWFLLALRFCIPPDISIDAGLSADFDAMGGGLEVDAGIAASISADLAAGTTLESLLGGMSFTPPSGPPKKTMAGALKAARFVSGRAGLDDKSFASVARAALCQQPVPPPDRVFAARVTREQVVRP